MSYYIVSKIIKEEEDRSGMYNKIYHRIRKIDPAIKTALKTAFGKKPGALKLVSTVIDAAEQETKNLSVPADIRNNVK